MPCHAIHSPQSVQMTWRHFQSPTLKSSPLFKSPYQWAGSPWYSAHCFLYSNIEIWAIVSASSLAASKAKAVHSAVPLLPDLSIPTTLLRLRKSHHTHQLLPVAGHLARVRPLEETIPSQRLLAQLRCVNPKSASIPLTG